MVKKSIIEVYEESSDSDSIRALLSKPQTIKPPENNNATLDEFEITDLIPPATIKPKHQVIKKDKKEKNEKKSKKKKKEKIKSKKSEEESN